jgi:AcrR family transcriptional regulator
MSLDHFEHIDKIFDMSFNPIVATGQVEQVASKSIKASGKPGPGTRERILASAERLFGELGFDGVSARRIAIDARVPVALVTYHFGSKEGLYRAVFDLRTPTIVDQRVAGLQVAASETDPDRRLELVIKALIVPMIHLRNTEKNASFARILAREISDPSSNDRKIIHELFDPVARRMIDAIAAALPDRSLEEVHWAYHVMLGAMVFIMADTGRIARLSGGRCDPDDEAATAAHMVALLHAALKHGRVGQAAAARSN